MILYPDEEGYFHEEEGKEPLPASWLWIRVASFGLVLIGLEILALIYYNL